MHDVYKGFVAPKLDTNALKTSSGKDIWAINFTQFWVDYEGIKSGKGRPVNFVDSFPFSIWVCQPRRFAQSQKQIVSNGNTLVNLSKSESTDFAGRLQRKKLLKQYYSTDVDGQSVPLQKSQSLDSSLSVPPPADSPQADIQVLAYIQKHMSAQMNHYQYIFLLLLQESLKQVMDNLRKDVEGVTGKPTEDTKLSIGLLLKSAEVSLLLHPLPEENTSTCPISQQGSPLAGNKRTSPAESTQEDSICNSTLDLIIDSGSGDSGAILEPRKIDLPDVGLSKSFNDAEPRMESLEKSVEACSLKVEDGILGQLINVNGLKEDAHLDDAHNSDDSICGSVSHFEENLINLQAPDTEPVLDPLLSIQFTEAQRKQTDTR